MPGIDPDSKMSKIWNHIIVKNLYNFKNKILAFID